MVNQDAKQRLASVIDDQRAPARTLSADEAGRLVEIALGHVGREFPYYQNEALFGPDDLKYTPRDYHPIFYGSYDWHSCVHGYWLLVRLNRLYPALPQRGAIIRQIDQAFTPAKVAGEISYFGRKYSDDFERPYGWAWFLKLAAELNHYDDERGRGWAKAIAPMATYLADKLLSYFGKLPRPTRDGVHSNTAFSMAIALDYADAVADSQLRDGIRNRAIEWFLHDVAPTEVDYGPSDFLSPTMMEAEVMRRVMPVDAFRGWLQQFLPRLTDRQPSVLFEVAVVTDPSDGSLAHLDGVNLTRAWAMYNLAHTLGDDPRSAILRRQADIYLSAGVNKVSGHYMSEHWLSTYALLALEAAEGLGR